jgi:hypothetical protein
LATRTGVFIILIFVFIICYYLVIIAPVISGLKFYIDSFILYILFIYLIII